MLIKAQQVAEILDVPLQRVYAMARSGIFEPGIVVRFSHTLRWNERLLNQWIEAGGNSAESKPPKSER